MGISLVLPEQVKPFFFFLIIVSFQLDVGAIYNEHSEFIHGEVHTFKIQHTCI